MADDRIGSIFITGLRNAHAVEQQALQIMNRQVERLESYPDLEARLRQHIDETKGQAERLEAILDDLGEDHSTFKDTMSELMGNMAALGHSAAGDEVLKNSFADYAFENYEIAAYKSLISMAEAAGVNRAVAPLQQNLREEEAMASWLADHLEGTTQRYLSLEAQGQSGKN